MNKELGKEMTEEFAKIYEEYNSPKGIKKRKEKKRIEEIREEKKSSYCLE